MRIYNTLTKQVEDFIPNVANEVKLYTCGPTVYHYAHIGNLRSYIFADILEKSLNYLGYKVTRFMNITDLGHLTNDSDTGEDKMSKSAIEQGKTVEEIADFYTAAFFKDFERLNISKPELIDKASNVIDKYIEITEVLISNGDAYVTNGNVYFDIKKAPNYYQLSGRSEDDNQVGVRCDVEEDENKKNPGDFGLWFTNSKFMNQIQKYDSPWGQGYPGWHIECTGLAIKYLGKKLDIHTGGVDNIFPHHTNEIAQSEAYLGGKWCNYWMHCEHLNDAEGKMSKSKGESLILNILIEKGYNPIAYRYFVLGSHYRNQLAFSYEALDSATVAYNKLKQKVSNLIAENIEPDQIKINEYQTKFKEALANDLTTSTALTILYDLLKDKTTDVTKLFLIKEFDKVLSLSLLEKNDKEVDEETLIFINCKINERNRAKQKNNYELADQIRNELKDKGILLKDTKETTTWELI